MDTLESLLAAIAPTGASRDILNPATGELELVERTFDPAWDVPAEAAQDQPVSLPETPETDPPADAGAEA